MFLSEGLQDPMHTHHNPRKQEISIYPRMLYFSYFSFHSSGDAYKAFGLTTVRTVTLSSARRRRRYA
jgi:hypothetical protein